MKARSKEREKEGGLLRGGTEGGPSASKVKGRDGEFR